MACTQERQTQLGELAGGRLGGEAVEELLEHVEGCAECSDELEAVALLVSSPAPAAGARPRSRRLALAAAAALAVSLGLYGLGTLRDSSSPGDAAAQLVALADIEPVVPPETVLRGERAERNDWTEALEHYEAARWSDAAAALTELRAQGDERALLSLYLGIARFQAGDHGGAATSLRRAADDGTGLVRQRGLWTLAHVHLASADGHAAIAVLDELLLLDEEYGPNAAELLPRVRALVEE